MRVAATCSTSSCRSRRCSNVAEAILRVFHRLGDYEHKQRNRLKFLIRAARLGPLARSVRAGARRSSAPRAARRCRSIRRRRRSTRRRLARPTAPSVEDIARPSRRPSSRGPGIVPTVRPVRGDDPDYVALDARRNVRPQKQPGYVDRHGDRAARRFHRRADARACRVSPRRSATARCASRRSESVVPVGAAADGAGALSTPRRGRARAGGRRHDRRRHELPGRRIVQARRDAIARPRPSARRSSSRASRLVAAAPDATSRSAAVRTAAASITSPSIGFQGSVRKVGGRPCRSTS